MRAWTAAVLAIALAGCATSEPFPSARPLTQTHIDAMGSTPIVVSESNAGVQKSWFFQTTQGAGAAYGLLGVLVSAAMDAIINAGPSRRAQKAADEIAELVSLEALNASLAEHLNQQRAPIDAAPAGVSYSEVRVMQRLGASDPLDDAVEVAVSYTLSEDSSTLRIVANAAYNNVQTPYATQYQFKGAPPRSETQGPAYRNVFTYESSQLPVPTLTPELRERLVTSIQDSARDANGNLPEQGSQEHSAMNRELENARDDRLTKDEISIFLTREWLRDDGAMLRREIEQAHTFIAQYLLLDLNRTAVPSLSGQDELIETLADQRTVRRIGSGSAAGAYVSSAGNVASFATYGNASAVARVHTQRAEAIREQTRRSRR